MHFNYHRPAHLTEALELLADPNQDQRLIAYGSDFLVWAKSGIEKPAGVIDLTGIQEINCIKSEENGLFLGAAVSLGDINCNELIKKH